MSDLIMRFDALDMLHEKYGGYKKDNSTKYHAYRIAHQILQQIFNECRPANSIDMMEIVPGRWKSLQKNINWKNVDCAECSICGEVFVIDDIPFNDFKRIANFCPSCGACMKGEQNEQSQRL